MREPLQLIASPADIGMLFQELHPLLQVSTSLSYCPRISNYALEAQLSAPGTLVYENVRTSCRFARVIATLSRRYSAKKPTSRSGLLRTRLNTTACREARQPWR